MADSPVEALLAAAAEVLDGTALRSLAGSLRPAAEPAPVRYRRLVDALGATAAEPAAADGVEVAEFLAGDAVVLALMSAAIDVIHDSGVEVDRGGEPVDHLRRAVKWRRRAADGSMTVLHRRCAADIARGSLRLWVRAGGVPQPLREPPKCIGGSRNRQARAVLLRSQAQLARVQLSGRARSICATLRADLGRQAAELPRGGVSAFEGRVRGEVLRVGGEFDALLSRRLAELAEAVGMPAVELIDLPGTRFEPPPPPRRRSRLEHHLTFLLGIGFGFSVSLTASRVIADLRPDWEPAAVWGCGAVGVLLTAWVVGARRLLTERAAMERGAAEAVADLRAALDERVVTRVLAVESALAAVSAEPVVERRRTPRGPHSQLPVAVRPALTFKQDDG